MSGDVFRALADPTRRALLDVLRTGPATTTTLAAAFPTTRFAVMKHLQVLVDAGVVVVERRGRERWNHLDPVPLRRMYERWLAPYAEELAVTALSLERAAVRPRVVLPDPEDPMTVTAVPPALGSLDVRTELHVAAPRDRVWDALFDIGSWWPHRFVDGSTVRLDAEVGGRFREEWDGGGALYGVVRRVETGTTMEVDGPMGVHGPVAAVWTLQLADDGPGTRVTLAHRGFGDIAEESQRSYAEGWQDVLATLAAHATNSPAPADDQEVSRSDMSGHALSRHGESS